MKTLRLIARFVFYLLILLIFLSRAAHWGFSHDENQFITAGQLLADHGLLPYINFPYTHMPYVAFFFAITARLSTYDYLAGRILNAVAWLICSLLIVYIFKLFWGTKPSFAQLIWEFVIVFIFLNHPSMSLVSGVALNHSLSSLFSLLALMFFVQFVQQRYSPHWAAFGCGACICLAALIRFNYASLIVVLVFLFWIYKWTLNPPRFLRSFLSFTAGLLMASLPALVLFLLAPYRFYYGNLVYTRLNTLYYQELHYTIDMDLGSKLSGFLSNTFSSPLNLILYALLLFVGITSFVLYLQKKLPIDLNILAVAAFAFTLFLTAFAPTPTQQQYYFAPVPFLMIILAVVGSEINRINKSIFYVLIVGMLIALNPKLAISNPLDELKYLSNPSQWTPIKVHDFAEELKEYVPRGRILTLLPMIPLEAGYDTYPFTTNGSFSWRTSLLLTSQGRTRYGIISPDELPGFLNQDPPDAILTGFEASNAGFTRNDPGTLETPFIDYAKENGYKPIIVPATFIQRPITLWVKEP